MTGVNLNIINTNLYVPVITFSINDDLKFLENLKRGFIGTMSSNKYRSETTT